MKRTLCILVILVLAPLGAKLRYSEAYECGDCHSPEVPINDCLASGCHDTYDNGNHHTTQHSLDGTCTVCHDPNLVADYDEENPSSSTPGSLTPTVESCRNCHKGNENPLDENQDPYPHPLYNTAILEHMDLQGHVSWCTLCHPAQPPDYPIRQCETCHTVDTLHNIAGHAVTPPDSLPYNGYWYDENGVWTEITESDRCIACHGAPPDPAPDTMLYVSQDVGTYDTTYSELAEGDCRGCHGLSLAERHHQLLTPPPLIDKLKRRRREPGQRFNLVGSNFGGGNPGDYVRIGSKELPYDHNRIIEWTPMNIKVKIPKKKYVKNGCAWFQGLDERKVKVWVNVGGVDSNKKRLTLIKNPADCL